MSDPTLNDRGSNQYNNDLEYSEMSQEQLLLTVQDKDAEIERLRGVIYRNCDPMAALDDDAKIINEIAALEDK